MTAIAGVVLLHLSAYLYGLWIPIKERGITGIMIRHGLGLGIVSYSVFLLGYLHLIYPATLLALLILPYPGCFCSYFWSKSFRNRIQEIRSTAGRLRDLPGVVKIILVTITLLTLHSTLEALHMDLCVDPYHVNFARSYLNNHRIDFLPGELVDCYPKLIELLITILCVFEPESSASVLQSSFILMTSLALYAGVSRWMGRLAGGLAGLLFASQVLVQKFSTLGFVDTGVCYYVALALIPIIKIAGQSHTRLDVLLAGIFLGAAVSVKVTSSVFVIIPVFLGLSLLSVSRGNIALIGTNMISIGIMGVVSLLVYLPWMVRNTIHAGSPFAPFLLEMFPLKPEFQNGVFWFTTLHPIRIQRFIDQPWWSIKFYYDQIVVEGSSAGALMPFAVVGILISQFFRRNDRSLFLALVSILSFLAYTLVGSSRSGRFIFPILPFFCYVCGVAGSLLYNHLRPQYHRPLVTLLCIYLIIVVIAGTTPYRGVFLHTPLWTSDMRDRFLNENGLHFDRLNFINQTLGKNDHLALGHPYLRSRHLEVPFTPVPFWGPTLGEYLWSKAQEENPQQPINELLKKLRKRGVTHFYMEKEPETFPSEVLELIHEWDDAGLYKVVDRFETNIP